MADLSGNVIELVKGNWPNHICLEVDEIPDLFIISKEDEFCKVAFVKDEDGNRIELYQKKGETNGL
jgi:hypothetical protein